MRNGRFFNFIRGRVARMLIAAIAGDNTLTKRKDPRNQASISASMRFGASSFMAKALHNCLMPHLKPFVQGYIVRAANALFNRMTNEMDKEELKYRFDPKPRQHLLVGHQFYQIQSRNEPRVRRKNFDHICKIPVRWEASPDRRRISFRTESFHPKQVLKAPKSVTHFQLVMLSGILMPVTYHTHRGKLKMDESEHRIPPQICYSEVYSLKMNDCEFLPPIVLEQNRDYQVPEEGVVVVCLGIRFFDRRYHQEKFYDSDSRMKIAFVI